jgi:hypothetical protein
MKEHQIHIFATKADLGGLLQAIESKQQLQFVRAGLFDTPTLNRVTTLLSDANLGIATTGDNNHETRYLVADQRESIKIESVPQYGGGTKYAIGRRLSSGQGGYLVKRV